MVIANKPFDSESSQLQDFRSVLIGSYPDGRKAGREGTLGPFGRRYERSFGDGRSYLVERIRSLTWRSTAGPQVEIAHVLREGQFLANNLLG